MVFLFPLNATRTRMARAVVLASNLDHVPRATLHVADQRVRNSFVGRRHDHFRRWSLFGLDIDRGFARPRVELVVNRPGFRIDSPFSSLGLRIEWQRVRVVCFRLARWLGRQMRDRFLRHKRSLTGAVQ
ncbi:hypothetical protein WI75_25565 [Burkholderia ubonensis]|nr:hypothetical protein WI75_25565 [Burkholderia ubonensis]